MRGVNSNGEGELRKGVRIQQTIRETVPGSLAEDRRAPRHCVKYCFASRGASWYELSCLSGVFLLAGCQDFNVKSLGGRFYVVQLQLVVRSFTHLKPIYPIPVEATFCGVEASNHTQASFLSYLLSALLVVSQVTTFNVQDLDVPWPVMKPRAPLEGVDWGGFI